MTVIEWSIVAYICTSVVATMVLIVWLYVNNDNLRREVDRLTRSNDKMKTYIAKRDKDRWERPLPHHPRHMNATRELPTIRQPQPHRRLNARDRRGK